MFKNTIISNNVANLKARDVTVIVLFSTRCLNRLTDIEFALNNLDRRTITITFANINKISTEKELNIVEAKEFEAYANNCNSENLLIVFLIFRNRLFAVIIFIKNAIRTTNYAKKSNDEDVSISENFDVNVICCCV